MVMYDLPMYLKARNLALCYHCKETHQKTEKLRITVRNHLD